MANKKILTFVLFFLLLSILSGCAARPKYAHESFNPQEINRITVLPFMDNRKNPDPELNFEKMVGYAVSSMIHSLMYDKKYRIVISGDIGNVSSYSIQDLPSPGPNSTTPLSVDPESVDSGWIKQLGPSTEAWILVPVLESLSFTNAVIGVFASAKISAYLFNKYTGELWWQCASISKFQTGILTYGMMKAMISEDNFLEASVVHTAGIQCANVLPVRDGPFLLPDK